MPSIDTVDSLVIDAPARALFDIVLDYPRMHEWYPRNRVELIGGGDPLPFGLGVNRPTIEALIAYAYSQKIIPTQIQPEEVFAPNALDL